MFIDTHVNANKKTGYLWGEKQDLDDENLTLCIIKLYSLYLLKLW